jgi:hypothetical protein
MVDRRRFLAGLGSLAIGSGALIQSGAFSTVRGDRRVNLQTADDTNALLGLGGVSDAGTTPTFTNNSAGSMDVTLDSTHTSVEFDVDDTGSFTSGPVSFTLSPGGSRKVAVSGGNQTVPVSVTGVLLDSNGNSDGRISLTREYAVSQAGQIQLTPNVFPGGQNGKYEFELENTGSIDVTMIAVGINETSNDRATEVAKGGILNVGGTSVMSEKIPINSDNPDQNNPVDFDANSLVDLPIDDTKTFEFDKFRAGKAGGPGGGPGNSQGGGNSANVDMTGETVTATFYFSDKSSKTISMSP